MFKGQQIHLINPFGDAMGGSEWRTISLYQELSQHCEVKLWSPVEPHPFFANKYSIQRLRPLRGCFPKTGTLVFMGVYFFADRWVQFIFPRRIIMVYNTFTPEMFFPLLRRLSLKGLRKVDIVYASELIKNTVGYPGIIEPSLIDTQSFIPAEERATRNGVFLHPLVAQTVTTQTVTTQTVTTQTVTTQTLTAQIDSSVTGSVAKEQSERFVIGRLSRDVPEKHHEDDPALYQALVAQGFGVKIMGGTCLSHALEEVPFVTLLPSGAEPTVSFLQGLDCFFYRTSRGWTESFGRVVLEAMACGLPVVCGNRGGYTEWIKHGENGYLFETDEEAIAILQRLQQDSDLRARIGEAARETTEGLYAATRRREIVNYYLR